MIYTQNDVFRSFFDQIVQFHIFLPNFHSWKGGDDSTHVAPQKKVDPNWRNPLVSKKEQAFQRKKTVVESKVAIVVKKSNIFYVRINGR